LKPADYRQYVLEITNAPYSGDGYKVNGMLINGTYPGPTIEGNWGDNFHITVRNRLTNHNGTSIHWHGIRQLHTNLADGVPGVTQCPIPPGESMVYEFSALQYGTSWYHSHFSLQYPDGIVGPIVIHGPTSANYDIDLGPLLLTDWYHQDAFSLEHIELDGGKGGVPAAPSKLMNGCYGRFKCVTGDTNCNPANACTYTVNFVKGKKYKWGVVNTSALAGYTFWIDGHNFTVVQVDFVPIKPYETDHLNIGIGENTGMIVLLPSVNNFPRTTL
jgi:FtsP/CotA-like multicopper oxidase with cupredoxin domain